MPLIALLSILFINRKSYYFNKYFLDNDYLGNGPLLSSYHIAITLLGLRKDALLKKLVCNQKEILNIVETNNTEKPSA